MPFDDVSAAIAAISRGEIVVVLDDASRENEGDLILAAEFATPEKIAFMIRHTSGVICATLPAARLRELALPLMVCGEVRGAENVLVRVHSECLTGDIFGSTRCDCGGQLDSALEMIARAGQGVVVYLRGHEGRGIGLTQKMHAYKLQDQGRDTVEANIDLGLPVDSRKYDVGAQILCDLGVTTLKLMSNNPAKFRELAGYPLRIVERVPLVTRPTAENLAYLSAKQVKLGHYLDVLAQPGTPLS